MSEPLSNASDSEKTMIAAVAVEQRLALSRAAIARQLRGEKPEVVGRAGGETHAEPGMVSLGVSILNDWWLKHPLHDVATAGSELLEPVARRYARTHPVLLLGGAALTGAALVWIKPWRLLSGAALLGSLVGGLSLGGRRGGMGDLVSLLGFAFRKRR